METKCIKAIFLCDCFDDIPYKRDLANSLKSKGVIVEEQLWSNLFITRFIKSGRPDVLHFHSLHPFLLGRTKLNQLIKALLFISQLYILNLFGTKAIWTVHEWTHKLDGDITTQQAGMVGKFFHAMITHCDSTKQDIEQAFQLEGRDQVFVIPHHNYIGCYENKIGQQEARKGLNIPLQNLVFLLFGSIYSHKGHLDAIDAFQSLHSNDISLIIAGKPEDDGLKEQIENKIRGWENIYFIPGRIPDDSVQVYMNACDCAVMPYKVFTTSGVAVLTMSFGRACIAPEKGFFSDIVGSSGAFLYDSDDKDGLLKAMKQAIESKSIISDMGDHNLKRCESWTWDFIADKTFNIYVN